MSLIGGGGSGGGRRMPPGGGGWAGGAIGQAKALDLIERFRLSPHPEGGHYRETFRDGPGPDGRAKSTAILYLLQGGEVSHWHRVDAAEVWHFYAGGPMQIQVSDDGDEVSNNCLWHPDARLIGAPEIVPQVVVPAGAWQSARTDAAWSLVGCTVAPGFSFEHFEMAPPDWKPKALR
ncbi:MAG: cupin domain-containing protein [Pseudomonadota bacterium]